MVKAKIDKVLDHLLEIKVDLAAVKQHIKEVHNTTDRHQNAIRDLYAKVEKNAIKIASAGIAGGGIAMIIGKIV
jgi:uncharacterized protein YlxW (UPF0749 family)